MALKYSINARRRVRSSSVEVKGPCSSKRRTRMLNQSSIWFSQEQCLGVYTKRMRCVGRLGTPPASPSGAGRCTSLFCPGLAPRRFVGDPLTSPADWCVLSWSVTKIHCAFSSVATVCARWWTNPLRGACRRWSSQLLAGCDFAIGDQALRAVANVFVLLPRATSCSSGDAGLGGFGRRSAF